MTWLREDREAPPPPVPRRVQRRPFQLVAPFEPRGDQPAAIEALVDRIRSGARHTTLLGVTGSGKTFTMAHTIARLQRPTLVLAHNKTLAAQLYGEFRQLFPENAVEYFVSYYDYYQPEAYIPSTDLYIEKETARNDRLDKLRHRATRNLLTRTDVLIVASVSCIYGLGSPETYHAMHCSVARGEEVDRDEVIRQLTVIQYERNDYDFRRGTFRVTGDVLDVFPAHEDARAVRIEWWGETVEAILEIDPLTGEVLAELEEVSVHPMSHYVTPDAMRERAILSIEAELEERLAELRRAGKLLEAQRLEQRTRYDLEMLRETGICNGIENYSRHLTGRRPGEPPACLIDYFPDDFLLIVDESHVTLPQLGGMYRGDRSRKETLVEHGFRLPSALDNRPLTFEEFNERIRQALYVSATPGDYELEVSGGVTAEQVVRPTGLCDPPIEVRPTRGQVVDLLGEVRRAAEKGERVLVTTLTKRMAEDLTEHWLDEGVRVRYLHSEIDAIERADILRELRLGSFDCLVGINLLREGLDLPEVALVAILDADKEGFLRSHRALIQTCGRAARNVAGRVIMYADRITDAMRRCIEETERRRAKQIAYNEAHGITPETIRKRIAERLVEAEEEADYITPPVDRPAWTKEELDRTIEDVRRRMLRAAQELAFEQAAELRDELFELEAVRLELEGQS